MLLLARMLKTQTRNSQFKHWGWISAWVAWGILLWALAAAVAAEAPHFTVGSELTRPQKLAELKVGRTVYSSVTITSVTATDIYFEHSQGMGNAKLKQLEPELQQLFGYDAAKAEEAEQEQRTGNAQYQEELKNAGTRKPGARPPAGRSNVRTPAAKPPAPKPRRAVTQDVVVANFDAKSFRGKPAPKLVVEEWITSRPDLKGKFVLVDFWSTAYPLCREAIPRLNQLQERFKDQLVIIGLSDEKPDDIRKMQRPKIGYAVATDTRKRMKKEVKMECISHCLLIDPKGIVRFEGASNYLTRPVLEFLLEKYSS